MRSPRLFDEDDSDSREPELIPHRERVSHSFGKPFEIRVVWLLLLGAALLIWRISLSDWQSWLRDSGQLLWLGAVLPIGFLWWRLRRMSSRRRRSVDAPSGTDRPQIRLVGENEEFASDEVASWKLVGGMIGYVVAVLTLIVIALWRMLS